MQIPTALYLLCFLSFSVASLNSELNIHAPKSKLEPISPAHTQHKPLQPRGGLFSKGHTTSEYYPECETAFAHDYCDHHCTCGGKSCNAECIQISYLQGGSRHGVWRGKVYAAGFASAGKFSLAR